MPENFDITIDTAEVDRMLAAMPLKFAKGVIREALQAAGDVMLAPMKALCPERTDDIEDSGSNSLEPGVLRESLTTQVIVGLLPRVEVGAPIETTRQAWWIEDGFDQLRAKKHIEGKHFMAGAFDESAEEAVNVLMAGLAKVLESDQVVE